MQKLWARQQKIKLFRRLFWCPTLNSPQSKWEEICEKTLKCNTMWQKRIEALNLCEGRSFHLHCTLVCTMSTILTIRIWSLRVGMIFPISISLLMEDFMQFRGSNNMKFQLQFSLTQMWMHFSNRFWLLMWTWQYISGLKTSVSMCLKIFHSKFPTFPAPRAHLLVHMFHNMILLMMTTSNLLQITISEVFHHHRCSRA